MARPPTTTGLPLSEGSNSSSTETKNASISRWKYVRFNGRLAVITRGIPAKSGLVSTLGPLAQHSADAVRGQPADFQDQTASGFEQAGGFGDEAAVDIEAIRSTEDRDVRLEVADLALDVFLVGAGNIRRIADNEIEGCGCERRA